MFSTSDFTPDGQIIQMNKFFFLVLFFFPKNMKYADSIAPRCGHKFRDFLLKRDYTLSTCKRFIIICGPLNMVY